MMGATHGLLGAAIGAHSPGLRTALGGAVASHFLADVVPHAHGPTLSPLLTLGALAVVVRVAGLRSLAALGFVAAIAPDIEHLPGDLGWSELPFRLFPSHWDSLHGATTDEYWSQGALMLVAIFAVVWGSRRPPRSAGHDRHGGGREDRGL